jgi:hypothetical protein
VVVCESEPEVAVTVTVEVADVTDAPGLLALPQPKSRPAPAAVTVIISSSAKLRRFLHPKRQTEKASAVPGSSGRELWCKDAESVCA